MGHTVTKLTSVKVCVACVCVVSLLAIIMDALGGGLHAFMGMIYTYLHK